VGEQAPLAAALQEVEDGVQDLAKIVGPRPSKALGCGEMGLDVCPFGIGKIRRVRFPHAC
jgi:hypothetical protein